MEPHFWLNIFCYLMNKIVLEQNEYRSQIAKERAISIYYIATNHHR